MNLLTLFCRILVMIAILLGILMGMCIHVCFSYVLPYLGKFFRDIIQVFWEDSFQHSQKNYKPNSVGFEQYPTLLFRLPSLHPPRMDLSHWSQPYSSKVIVDLGHHKYNTFVGFKQLGFHSSMEILEQFCRPSPRASLNHHFQPYSLGFVVVVTIEDM